MKRLLHFLLALLPFAAGAQQAHKPPVLINIDTLTSKAGYYRQLAKWEFMEADSPAMALPGYDDSKWTEVSSELRLGNKNKSYNNFNSIGWFRYHFIADSSIVNIPLAYSITEYGACEIYFDGKKIDSFGHIGDKKTSDYCDPQKVPSAFIIPNAGPHVIAVRYANFNAQKNLATYKHNLGGFKMYMGQANYMIIGSYQQMKSNTFIYMLLFGIFVCLSVLHLFLFLYYRTFKANLFFCLFCLSLAAGFLTTFLNFASYTPEIIMANTYTAAAVCVVACYSLSGFINDLFSAGKWRFRVVTIFCVAAFAFWCLNNDMGMYGMITLIVLVALEALILTCRAIYQKVKGAKIIGAGVLFFTLFVLTIAVIGMVFGDITVSENSIAGAIILLLIALAILSLPISMSLYVAWSFASVSRNLKSQLSHVQRLSEQSLEQEQEKKRIIEGQKEKLEEEVTIRTAEVIAQKKLVEIKNKAITDNINYAQRIQSAILPDIKLINKALEQSFILFLPKDIVSGDFYAFAQKNGGVLIIAGDCTGHGVSGAFMSMIGSSLLNQIINEKGITQPALILNELNRAVIEALKQSENESNDGMDISICSFDLHNMELQFAGANRPLWLLRNNEIEIYRPDKFPIGGLQMARDRVFTNHTMQLRKNDTIYIFTDGYADQFGGTMGKKMMTAKFKEMLCNIQHLGMPEQEAYLKAHFDAWKGANEQVDDVLVIGVRA